MKKVLSLLALIFIVQFQVQAQSEKATVYLLRPVGPDDYIPYFTYLNHNLLCKLGNGKYSIHEVDPGEYKMHSQYKGKVKSTPEAELQLQFEAGKTYYIQVSDPSKDFRKEKFYCKLLSEDDAKEILKKPLVNDKKCL